MPVHTSERAFATTSGTDILDITEVLVEAIGRSGVREGHAVVFVPGSTAAVTTIEYEDGVIEDLRDAIERLAPRSLPYRHDARWGDGNGYAHVRAALLGPSLAVPIADGRPLLGTWQQVVLVDCDNRPRRRKVIMQVMGE
jgi:secondary thiamine-phosphate synthase enzyme